MHDAAYLKDHPDAAPVGSDGKPARRPTAGRASARPTPATAGRGWRRSGRALADFDIDGIWLDYHHAHASWEQAVPKLPDTCFCARCLARFARETGVDLPDRPRRSWPGRCSGRTGTSGCRWRCGVFTDWVREFRAIRDEVRPRRTAGDVPLPVVGGRLRRGAAGQAGDRPEGPGGVPRRPQPDAVPRPLRPRRRPGLDRAAGRVAGSTPGHRGQARRADSRSGRSCSSPTGASRSRPRRLPRCWARGRARPRRGSRSSPGALSRRTGTRSSGWAARIAHSAPEGVSRWWAGAGRPHARRPESTHRGYLLQLASSIPNAHRTPPIALSGSSARRTTYDRRILAPPPGSARPTP